MEETGIQRKLAAILAADVVGYSRLMRADEEATLASLKALRKSVVDPSITAHHGNIVKSTGDGLLIEFTSVVEAVRVVCRNVANSQKQPFERSVDTREFRIAVC